MIAVDEDALECDLMETYGIMNYRELPYSRVALFAVGLRESSRIKMKINGWNIDLTQQLIAMCADALNFLVWSKTRDAERGTNKPKSVYEALMGLEKKSKLRIFTTPEEFMQAWNSI